MGVVTGVETLLESETLSIWIDQSPVIDGAELYDQLRESLTMAQQAYREARARGWRGQADADRAAAEVANLTALLAVIVEGFDYRRGLYFARGGSWPLR